MASRLLSSAYKKAHLLPLKTHYDEEQLKLVLAPAIEHGETKVIFSSLDEAVRFRFACYSLRRRKGIGKGLSFLLDEAGVLSDNNELIFEVVIMKTPVFEVTRHI